MESFKPAIAGQLSRLWGLDLLRTFAILAVLFLHTAPFLPALYKEFPRVFVFGWAGVDLFFVLSGFLVGSQALRAPVRNFSWLRDFWVRRWTRTLPLYFLVLFVYVAVKPRLGFPFQEKITPFFFFAQNYLAPHDFVQSWSLCIEEQFYFFLPLVVLAVPGIVRWPFSWLILLVLSFVSRWYWIENTGGMGVAEAAYRLQFPTHTHLDGLALGLVLAATQHKWTGWGLGRKCLLAAAGFFILAISFYVADPSLMHPSALWLFSALALGFAAWIPLACTWKRPVLGGTLVEQIAIWSYGLYLWNNLVFRVAERLPLTPILQGVFGWALSFALASLTYQMIEVPGLKLRSLFLSRSASRAKSL